MAITILKKGDIISDNNREFIVILEPENEAGEIKVIYFDPYDDGSAPPDLTVETIKAYLFRDFKKSYHFKTMKEFWNAAFKKWN